MSVTLPQHKPNIGECIVYVYILGGARGYYYVIVIVMFVAIKSQYGFSIYNHDHFCKCSYERAPQSCVMRQIAVDNIRIKLFLKVK